MSPMRATGPLSFYLQGPCNCGRWMPMVTGTIFTKGKREKPMQAIGGSRGGKQRGFTLIEMMIAMLMMTVGLLAVAQLVPFSIRLNTANRDDSTALVLAQNEMNQFIEQPLANPTFIDAAGNNYTRANGARRFILGVLRLGGNVPLLPVNLDSMVER